MGVGCCKSWLPTAGASDGRKMGAVKLMWEKEAQSVLLGLWRDPVEYLAKWPKCKSSGTLGNCPLDVNSKVPWGRV